MPRNSRSRLSPKDYETVKFEAEPFPSDAPAPIGAPPRPCFYPGEAAMVREVATALGPELFSHAQASGSLLKRAVRGQLGKVSSYKWE